MQPLHINWRQKYVLVTFTHFMSRKNWNVLYCSCTKLKKIFLCLPPAKIEKNWGTVDLTHGMGVSFGWELTRAGATIHLDVITPLVASLVILSFEHFLSQTLWELLLKCIKKCKCFANYTITPHPDKTSRECCQISLL